MKTVIKEYWDDQSTNKEQQYLTHKAFRYFGKLPPTLTRKILSIQNVGKDANNHYVELMCGSGTGIVEAMLLGANATGIDCNPLALLATRVKTTSIPTARLQNIIQEFDRATRLEKITAKNPPPNIRNIDKWFSKSAKKGLCAIRDWIAQMDDDIVTDVYRLALASSIRSCSNASVRTGRLFFDCDKIAPFPLDEFRKRLVKLCEAIGELSQSPMTNAQKPRLEQADARSTGLQSKKYHSGLCHPPYFALYRYSSDVLRFELDWLNYSREEVSNNEIEDGFKTTNAALVLNYIRDMIAVLAEAHRIIVKNGTFAIVTADSTLRKERLEIIQPLVEGAARLGWKLERHVIRKIRYAQASYHRSADPTIQRPEDEVLFFRAA